MGDTHRARPGWAAGTNWGWAPRERSPRPGRGGDVGMSPPRWVLGHPGASPQESSRQIWEQNPPYGDHPCIPHRHQIPQIPGGAPCLANTPNPGQTPHDNPDGDIFRAGHLQRSPFGATPLPPTRRGPSRTHPGGGLSILGGVRASRGGSEHPFWPAAVAGRLAPAGLRGRNLPMEIFGSCPAVVSGHFCRQGFLVLFRAAPGAHHVPLRAAAVPRPQKTSPGRGLTGPCRGQAMPERPRSPG